MKKLNIAVLGAGGIGMFHVRELARAGADVVAILGSSKRSASETAEIVHNNYGVSVRAYDDLDELLANEHLDGVSICTPPQMHFAMVKKCLESGLHVLCEKPLVQNSTANNYPLARELVSLSEQKNKVLTVNSQWPAILGYVKNEVDLAHLKSFTSHKQPAGVGMDMLTEQMSHPNSLVVHLIPKGLPANIRIEQHSDKHIDVYFSYANNNGSCDVRYEFTHKPDRPRKVRFSFNGVEFRREIGEHYEQSLVTDTAVYQIEDPFKISIGKFVGAVKGTDSPLVGKQEILENVALQDAILAAYQKGLKS